MKRQRAPSPAASTRLQAVAGMQIAERSLAHREGGDGPPVFRAEPGLGCVLSQTHVVTCLLTSPNFLRGHFFWLTNTRDRPTGERGSGLRPEQSRLA